MKVIKKLVIIDEPTKQKLVAPKRTCGLSCSSNDFLPYCPQLLPCKCLLPSLDCRPNDSSFWQLLRVSRQPENSLRESLVFWVPMQEAEPQFSGRTSATQLNQENVCLAKSSRFATSPLSTISLLIKEEMEWLSPGVEPLPIVAPIVPALLHVLFPDTRDFLI